MKKGFTRAECAAHAEMSGSKRKAAFTLAEVLITLGIIGIVIAMTLPSLIANYQRKVWAAQLQQTMTLLTVGFHKISSEAEGLENTSLGTRIYFTMADGSVRGSETHNDSFMYPFVKNYIKTTFKIPKVACGSTFDRDCTNNKIRTAKICDLENRGNCTDDWRVSGFQLMNGAVVLMHAVNAYKCGKTPFYKNSSMKTYCGTVIVDINGNQNPNKLGYDIFRFEFDREGNFFPYGGAEYVKAMYSDGITNNEYWKNNPPLCCTKRGDGRRCNWAQGWSCAGRVVENGWVIDY